MAFALLTRLADVSCPPPLYLGVRLAAPLNMSYKTAVSWMAGQRHLSSEVGGRLVRGVYRVIS